MIKRILVPLDGSDLAKEVLPYVEDLAKSLQAEVYFVEVVSEVPATATAWPAAGALLNPELVAAELEEETKAAERHLAVLASEWQTKGLAAKWEVVRGAPGLAIVELARARNVDMVAMSTHGRSGLGRVIFGSVAEHVVREAGVPVLLIRPKG